MIRSTLIAVTAVAAFGLSIAPAAQAKTGVDLKVKIGFGSATILIGSPGYHADGACHSAKMKHTTWNKRHTRKITFFTRELVCY